MIDRTIVNFFDDDNKSKTNQNNFSDELKLSKVSEALEKKKKKENLML